MLRIDEVAVARVETSEPETLVAEVATQASFEALALLGFKVGVGNSRVTECQIRKADIGIVVRRRAKALCVLAEQRDLGGRAIDRPSFGETA